MATLATLGTGLATTPYVVPTLGSRSACVATVADAKGSVRRARFSSAASAAARQVRRCPPHQAPSPVTDAPPKASRKGTPQAALAAWCTRLRVAVLTVDAIGRRPATCPRITASTVRDRGPGAAPASVNEAAPLVGTSRAAVAAAAKARTLPNRGSVHAAAEASEDRP